MPVQWVPVTLATSQAYVAQMEGFSLTIMGRNGEWWWLAHRGECAHVEGTEHTLMDAKIAAENAARRMAGDSEPGAM